jgi:hypothetical protein
LQEFNRFRILERKFSKKYEILGATHAWICICLKQMRYIKHYFLLTYLCGTTTNTWLRPVKEHLSACLEHNHSAFNLWPLGPCYRWSPHSPTWILVFLECSFHWVWLCIEFSVVGVRVFWSCDQRSAIYLSSWHSGHSGCQTPYRVVPPPVDTIFEFQTAYCLENLPLKYEQLVHLSFGQHPRFSAVEQDWPDQGLVNGEFCLAWKVARPKFFKVPIANCHVLPHVTYRPIIPGRII